MSTRERLHKELDELPEDRLEEVSRYMTLLMPSQRSTTEESVGIMEKLRRIKFDGPADMSERHTEYAVGNGELASLE